MKPLLSLLQFIFGCRHSGLSRVFTIKKRTYQVCFECGREFEYSWELMRPMHAVAPRVALFATVLLFRKTLRKRSRTTARNDYSPPCSPAASASASSHESRKSSETQIPSPQPFKPLSHILTPTPCAGMAMFTVWAVHSQEKQHTADPASHVPTSIKASQTSGSEIVKP
jgi:hypothetical protein